MSAVWAPVVSMLMAYLVMILCTYTVFKSRLFKMNKTVRPFVLLFLMLLSLVWPISLTVFVIIKFVMFVVTALCKELLGPV